MLWIMASRSRWARRWCLAAATGCALVCAAALPAHAQDRAAVLSQLPGAVSGLPGGAPAEIAALSGLSFLPAAPLVPDALVPDLLIPPYTFAAIRRSQTRVFTGNGFDTCHAPSPHAMSAWWTSSPYRALGIYIGGLNRACADGYLSNGWVHAVTAMGWHLMPIYVGRQAPCTHQPDLKLMRAKTAADDAAAAADDAASRAAAFGIARGSAIYFDLESYGRKDAACTNTVLRYIGAWTDRLHAHGYLAGVYSSAGSGITDLAHSTTPGVTGPDALWIARWNNDRSVQDTAVPDGTWTAHQRIKQFTGGHKETHGGVTMDIDRDWLDGPVARIG